MSAGTLDQRSTSLRTRQREHSLVNPFQHVALARPRHADVVDQREVDDHLAETDAAGMRADGDAGLGGHQQDREDLVDTGQAARVDLADVDRLSLEELLEDHAVVADRARGRGETRQQ